MIKFAVKWTKRLASLIIVVGALWHALYRLEEFIFYNDISHYKWARQIKKSNFDFFSYSWKGQNIPIAPVRGNDTYLSPKGSSTFYYYYPDKKKMPYNRNIAIYSHREKRGWFLENAISPDRIKWVFNETYLVYMDYEDTLFRGVVEVVYICNQKTGKVWVLTDSKVS